MRYSRRQFAFTLIELITVMAITAILLTIITVPMIQTFNATRTAQAYSDAQDKARLLTDRISREIGESVAVREIEGVSGRVSVVTPIPTQGIDDTGATQTTPGGFIKIGMNYTKLDLIMPQKVGARGAGGGIIDPVTGKEDPTLKSAKGQVQLPLAPGATIKRYWIGLNNPLANYNNPYDGFLMAKGGGRDNLFVLYSAEVQPVRMVETPAGSGNFVPQVNTDFFDADPADASGRTPLLDDPDFFLATNAAVGAPVNNDAKATRIRNWKRVAKIETEVSRYDMIQPQYDKSKRLVRMTNVGGVWSPRVTPLVLFRPSHVEGDGADAQVAASLGNEVEGSDQVGSELFQGQYRMWSNLVVRTYGLNWASIDPYQIARKDAAELNIYFVQPGTSGIADTTVGSGTELFSITGYEDAFKTRNLIAANRYPFSVGLDRANVASGWLSSGNAAFFSTFMPFYTNSTTGRVVASFNISEVGDFNSNPNTAANLFSGLDTNNFNLPQVPAQGTTNSGWTATDSALTPSNDPALATGVFSDSPFWETAYNRFNINRVFNKVWADAQAGRNGVPSQMGETGGAHRFIDLRVTPQGDGTPSPLGIFPRAKIVISSEEVSGPDQNPGPNYGYEVRYHRVNREPGPNEYRINYANIDEPTAAGYAALGLPVPPAAYDRTSFVSAVFQPRFKAGYIQLCSNPEVPIPSVMRIPGTTNDVPGRIRVSYKFQFTTPDDVVRVEYDTRQLMQVIMTIRNYPQSDIPFPQTVTMKATANVRNFIR